MTSAVEHVYDHVNAVLNAPGSELRWQMEKGENMTLDDFLSTEVVTMPACFISFGGFMANPDLVHNGRVLQYEDRVMIYLLHMGDMWPWATAIRDHFNTRPNNEFTDAAGNLRRLTLTSGDGVRLPIEGMPAFEMILTA